MTSTQPFVEAFQSSMIKFATEYSGKTCAEIWKLARELTLEEFSTMMTTATESVAKPKRRSPGVSKKQAEVVSSKNSPWSVPNTVPIKTDTNHVPTVTSTSTPTPLPARVSASMSWGTKAHSHVAYEEATTSSKPVPAVSGWGIPTS